jgi:hypothetical protein
LYRAFPPQIVFPGQAIDRPVPRPSTDKTYLLWQSVAGNETLMTAKAAVPFRLVYTSAIIALN